MIRGLLLLFLAAATIEAIPLGDDTHFLKWAQFKEAHGKSYIHAEEEVKRFNIFVENHQKILQHNEEFKAGKHTYELGMNQFGDLTNEEFRARVNGFHVPASRKLSNAKIFQAPNTNDLPESVDWRTKGYVTEVKNQGSCGSCWSFSATGALEGQHAKATGKLISLSEQNLIDCSRVYGTNGCGGGIMDSAFQYVKDNNGLDTESSYPYEEMNDRCRFNRSNVGATASGFVDIESGNEQALQSAIVTVGPISVAIDASRPSFQFYKGGLYHEPNCGNDQSNLDHGVLAVGYGVMDDGTKYYIVKNSWGTTWGDNGYVLMPRDKDNHCGIATMASYPTV